MAATAVIVPLATAPIADAAPKRTAKTTAYKRADFLQRTLGLTANPSIESVTYDRFQHLLRQPGTFALLIGDPHTDPTFKDRAKDVDAAAKAKGVEKVYWFNPNLTGGAKLGEWTVPTFDIRDSASIDLQESSRNKFKDAWGNLIAQSLGNGITANRTNPGLQTQTVVTVAGPDVNDAVNPLYSYAGGATPDDVTNSYFLVYNTDHTSGGEKDKIVSWIDLTDEASSASAQAAVTAAIGNATFARVEQFVWWKAEANNRHTTGAGSNPAAGGDTQVVTDEQNSAANGGWRVNQVTYPEIVDIFTHATDETAVVLFGGTWCPNTRAVLPYVNKYAQDNDVQVFNFDTVLDGGIVAGSPTSGSNPLQTRNAHGGKDANGDARFASFLYAELVKQYLSNFVTQYTTDNRITYFPKADTSGDGTTSIERLQVPYLFGYKGKGGTAAHGGINRQWIQKNANGSHTEYMTIVAHTHPKPSQLNLTTIPQNAPIWQKFNAALQGFTWQTDPTPLRPSLGNTTEDLLYLVPEDTADVTPTAGGVNATQPGSVNISPAAVTAALQALGATAPTTLAEARTQHVAARGGDPVRLGHLTTIAGAWTISNQRKERAVSVWANNTSPGGVAGALKAVHELDVFFGGLPGPAYATRKVTADTVKQGTASTISLEVSNYYERTVSGDISLVLKQGGTTIASPTATLANGAVSFALGALPAGTYDYTLSYAGNDQLAAFTESGTLSVTAADPVIVDPPPGGGGQVVVPITNPGPGPGPQVKVKAGKVAGAVSKAPTSKKAGKYKVTITTAKGLTEATGKVTLTLKKGKTTRKLTGTLKNGVVTVTVPKLARGTWKVSISWPGDGNYLAGKANGTSIKVKK